MCVDKRSEKGTIVCPTDDVCGVYDDGFVIFILFSTIVLTNGVERGEPREDTAPTSSR